MRGEKLRDVIRLAEALASNAEGMTLNEMAAFSKVGRRTVERWRDVIEDAFGMLERNEDGRQIRFVLRSRKFGDLVGAPTSRELAELENAARACEAANDPVRAEELRGLQRKINMALNAAAKRKLAPDVEGQLMAEALARQVGPRPYIEPQVMKDLRRALLAQRVVQFHYRSEPKAEVRWRKVIPYGLLLGPRYYLVARVRSQTRPVLFRLDRIEDLRETEEVGAPPQDFDLKSYADRSFGVFQEEPKNVVLRFDASAASDARAYVFHPTQSFADGADNSLTVHFKAGGLLQIAHHLMTWGSTVSVQAPDQLREILQEQVKALYAHHGRAPRKGPG